MIPEYFAFNLPTKIVYNHGLASRLGSELKEFGKRNALIITDKVIRKAGLLNKVLEGLQGSLINPIAIFDDVPPNSELKTVMDATEMGKANNCTLIIALGGGSVMDTAKVANILLFKGGKIEDHMGAQLIKGRLHPMVFIPTTAGTGSEVTSFAMISDSKNDVKLPFTEDAVLPDLAILDPEMTLTMPPKITAATGMDALTHAIEAYVSSETNPVSEALSLHAIELINQNILQATANPDDVNARGAMLVASFMAGVSFNHAGVGIVHGISHALGGVYHIPHGLANSIILPFSIEHNMETSAARYARITEHLGFVNIKPTEELIKAVGMFNNDLLNNAVLQMTMIDEWLVDHKARALAEKIRLLNRQLSYLSGHATNLKQAGINDGLAKLEQVIETAMTDGAMLYNPVEVTREKVRRIIQMAYNQDFPSIKVSSADLRAARAGVIVPKLKNIFSDTENMYDILGGFYNKMGEDSGLSNALLSSGLKVRFIYTNPDGYLTIDSSGTQVKVYRGKDGDHVNLDVEMTLSADLAHYFWHGLVNAVQALTRREITTKGNLPKAMALLPILTPAYDLYPKFLMERGLGKLVVR
jgi:alcohol dehydrogenase class IV